MMRNNLIIYTIWSLGMFYLTAGLTDCCNVVTIGTVIKATCSGCRLQTVPEDLPINTTELNLHNNNLTVLHKDSFRNLHELDNLILSSNSLSRIVSGALDGLQNLRYLDLSKNVLDNSSFDALVFQPLMNLKHLDFRQNKFHLKKTYPEHAISYLSQVETLQIDVFEGFHFGNGFLNLTNLKQLYLIKFIKERISLLNSTFIGLTRSGISHLDLSFPMKKVEINALAPFRNLLSLKLNSERTMDIRNMMKTLYGLQKKKMEYLTLTDNYYTSSSGVFLTKSDFVHLRTICVRRLDLTRNDINGISMGAVLSWSSRKCLEILDISWNSFKSPQLFTILVLFPSITHVNSSNQSFRMYKKRSTALTEEKTYFLPHSLIYLNVSKNALGGRLSNITFHESNNLKVLDLSYSSRHPSCYYGRIKGLLHLTEIYISGMDCSEPNSEMFASMPYLSKLEAKHCNLGNVLGKEKKMLFKGMHNLTALDLSANNIELLGSSVFADQQNSLKTLIISSNKLLSLQTHILVGLYALETLDVSYNLISTFTKSDIDLLDTYQTKYYKFTINLLGNPLLCNCETRDFLAWVGTTNSLHNRDDLWCYTADGSRIKVMTFLETFDQFQKQCSSQFWLITSLIMFVVLIITTVLSRLAWRHSVKLRVWCRQPLENEVFPFDVFISYCNDDSSWTAKTLVPWLEQGNIKYYCEDKSFELGKGLCDNIMNAIDNSRKSIFVVSCNYFKSEWQAFAMQLTNVYAFRDGREHMNVIILLDDLERSEFPKMIRKNWDEISPITWPDEHTCAKNKLTNARKKFWEKLLKRIKRGNTHFSGKAYSESIV